MKSFLLVLFVLFYTTFSKAVDFKEVDKYALTYRGNTSNVSKLAAGLTSRYTNDVDKVRSIFIWITNNIAYDFDKYMNRPKVEVKKTKTLSIQASSKEELERKKAEIQKEWAEEAANDSINRLKDLLSKEKGICEDYSDLFLALCKESNLKAGVIEGTIKTPTGQVITNDHVWNWVEIEKKIYLLDATWASGYVDYDKGKFIKSYKEGYFFATPEAMIMNHFPKNENWQLLYQKVTLEQFKNFALVGPGFFKYTVKQLNPSEYKAKSIENKFSFSIIFENKPSKIQLAENNIIFKEINSLPSDTFQFLFTPQKKISNLSVWTDGEFAISYQISQ